MTRYGDRWACELMRSGERNMTETVQQGDERKENKVVEKADQDDPNLLGEKADSNEGVEVEALGLRDSLRAIFSWRNYSVYLATSWVITSFLYMGLFLNLYFLELGWEYVMIGAVFSLMNFIAIMGRFMGGYLGDVVNRKHLSVVATLVLAFYNLILGLSTVFTLIFIALFLGALVEVFKSGSSAYIMENIPKEHSGLGISLFSASGRTFGVVTLAALVILVPILGFGSALRTMFFIGGVFLVIAAIARAVLLDGSPPKNTREGKSVFRSFIEDNRRAAGILIRAAPGLLAVVIVDGLSDSLFRFGSNIYIYEVIGIGFEGIVIITLSTTLLSVPMLLGMGRMTDRRGVTRAALLVYSAMPVCAALMFISPVVPYWAPSAWVASAESLVVGLGAVFSTPFIAVVIKSANDAVWYLILFTIIQKNLPKKDTSKILSTFWFVTYLSTSVGPYLGGLIFQFSVPQYLFAAVLALNIIIMVAIYSKGLVNKATMSDLNSSEE